MSCNSASHGLTRVCICTVPRTLGTALSKCLSFVDGMQILYEPFVSAYYFGPEGLRNEKEFIESASELCQDELNNAFDDGSCTYDWVRQQLESEIPGKKILLMKDQVYCLDEKYESLPPGLKHTFLIRHPYKVLPSWKRTLAKLVQKPDDTATFDEIGANLFKKKGTDIYEMQFKLLQYVQENLDPNPVIIDADDLQNSPASTLRQFCEAVGIPYSDSLLEWPANRDVINTWKVSRILLQGNRLEKEGGFYENALRSTKFLPGSPIPKRSDLSEDLQIVTDYSLPFYEKMHQMRLKP